MIYTKLIYGINVLYIVIFLEFVELIVFL